MIEEANSKNPGFAKVMKDIVVFTKPGEPLARAGKGAVQRQLPLERYQQIVDDLYYEPHIPNMAPGNAS